MADLKISQLPAATSCVSAQEFAANDSGTTRKVTALQIATYCLAGLGSAAYQASSAFDAEGAASAVYATAAADLASHAATTTTHGISAFGASLVDDANAAAARTTLGLATVASSGSASDLGTGTLPIARIAAGDVTFAKIQNVSATAKVLGRSTAGAGSIEEIDCTAAGRALIDDADAAAQRTTLGLGALAVLATVGTTEIANDAATYAKIQNVSATDKVLGRSTVGAGDVEEIACTAAGRALIDDADAATQRTTLGLATIAASGSASDLGTGTLPIARIAAGDVTYAKIQNVSATDKLLGRSTAGAGVTEEIACTAAGRALIDDVDAATQRTTLGLAIVASSASAADLSAGTLPAARMPALTGDVTTSTGAVVTTIANDAVTNAKLANVATATIKGRTTASTGDPEDLTGTQATALLDLMTETAKGLVAANTGIKARLAANLSIANTLTQVVGFTAAANTLKVGTTIRFRALGLLTNTTSASTSVLTLRINSASLGATIEASWSCVLGTTARTNCPFVVEGQLVVISAGAGGTAWGVLVVNCNTTTALALPTTMVTAAVTAITTQSNVVELACISGAATTTWNFITATIEIVQP